MFVSTKGKLCLNYFDSNQIIFLGVPSFLLRILRDKEIGVREPQFREDSCIYVGRGSQHGIHRFPVHSCYYILNVSRCLSLCGQNPHFHWTAKEVTDSQIG